MQGGSLPEKGRVYRIHTLADYIPVTDRSREMKPDSILKRVSQKKKKEISPVNCSLCLPLQTANATVNILTAYADAFSEVDIVAAKMRCIVHLKRAKLPECEIFWAIDKIINNACGRLPANPAIQPAEDSQAAATHNEQ